MVSTLCLLIVTAWTVLAVGQATDYCRFTLHHTMCKYSGRGPACGPEVEPSGVSPEDAAVIVALHNELRSKVARGEETRGTPGPQPSGADIRALVWDEELASLAQRHAEQCIFQHECSDCRRVDRFGVGQNLFMTMQFGSSQDEPDWRSGILSWYNEVVNFSKSNVHPYKFSVNTGHYSQVLWASTSLVGCGFTTFKEGIWLKGLYTCNYGPAGNILNGQVYAKGKPCSSCPAGTSCSQHYEGLCEGNEVLNSTSEAPSTILPPTSPNDSNNNSKSIVEFIMDFFNIMGGEA